MNVMCLLGGTQHEVIILAAVVFAAQCANLVQQRTAHYHKMSDVVMPQQKVRRVIRLKERIKALALLVDLVFIRIHEIRIGLVIQRTNDFKQRLRCQFIVIVHETDVITGSEFYGRIRRRRNTSVAVTKDNLDTGIARGKLFQQRLDVRRRRMVISQAQFPVGVPLVLHGFNAFAQPDLVHVVHRCHHRDERSLGKCGNDGLSFLLSHRFMTLNPGIVKIRLTNNTTPYRVSQILHRLAIAEVRGIKHEPVHAGADVLHAESTHQTLNIDVPCHGRARRLTHQVEILHSLRNNNREACLIAGIQSIRLFQINTSIPRYRHTHAGYRQRQGGLPHLVDRPAGHYSPRLFPNLDVLYFFDCYLICTIIQQRQHACSVLIISADGLIDCRLHRIVRVHH